MTELIAQQRSQIASLSKVRKTILKAKNIATLATIGVFVLAFVFMFLVRPVGVSFFVASIVGLVAVVALVITDFVFDKIISKKEDVNRRTVYSFEHPDRELSDSKASFFSKVWNAIKNFFIFFSKKAGQWPVVIT